MDQRILNHFADCAENALICDQHFGFSNTSKRSKGYLHDFAVSWDLFVKASRRGIDLNVVLEDMDRSTVEGRISQFFTRALTELDEKCRDDYYPAIERCYVKIGETSTRIDNGKPFIATFKGVERVVRKDLVPVFRAIVSRMLGL